MTEQQRQFIAEKCRELMAASSCCAEAKAAAQAWLDAAGTAGEHAETAKLIAELEEDVMSMKELADFAASEHAKKYFGEERAARILAHAQQSVAAGAKYCDCPACAAGAAILEIKDEL